MSLISAKFLRDHYDVVVCGAGPAGLVAVLRLQELDPDRRITIALLDRRSPWREPVACAEAVHRLTLEHLTEGSEEWIRGPVDGVVFVSPDGTKVPFRARGSGVVLDRALMHRRLAERGAAQGADSAFDALVTEIAPPDALGRRLVHLRTPAGERTLSARYVIDATGPGARFASGEPLVQGNLDIEPAAFVLARGIQFDRRMIYLYYGQQVAPGGYAWLFPRDGEVANVGVVADRAHLHSHPPRQLLEKFLADNFPQATWDGVHGGPIACGQDLRPLAHEGLFRAGDSANCVNPLSRGGILEAMKMGRYAADAIASLLQQPERKFAEAAERLFLEWMADKGKGHLQLHRAKGAFGSIPDKVLDRAAHRLSRIPAERMTMARIFWTTLTASPLLLWRMRSLLR
jgi:geranylgeranyl reductase family protein